MEGMVDGHPCRLYHPRRTRVPQLLDDASRWHERDFLVDEDRRISFAAHEQAVVSIAARLGGLGVGRGDRVMLLSANSPEMVACFWALLYAGAVAVLGNAWWSPGPGAR
jgi:long-chain acyl-CoA synthetase